MSRVESGVTTSEEGRPGRRPRWRRAFGLRTLMVLVLVAGCGLGWLAGRVGTRGRALAAIRAAGGKINFHGQSSAKSWFWGKLYRWTKAEFCREVAQVSYRDDAFLDAPPSARRSDVPGVTGPLLAAIGDLAEVETVVLMGCPIATSDLASLAGTAVRTLNLLEVQGLADDRPEDPPVLPAVTHLQIGVAGRGELPRSTLAVAARLPALERLYLESPLAPVRGDLLAPLARLRRLTMLGLNRTVVDESSLATLDEMPQLRAIWIRGARVGDATLARIVARHPDLLSIEVDGSALTDAGAASLAQLPRLAMVALRGTPATPGHLTDASLIALGRVKTLRRLVVTCGRFGAAGLDGLRGLKFLRLALGSVEPGSTPALIGLVGGQRLEWLRLGGPGVTDDLLPHLAPSLTPRRAILDLSDSAISDAGLAPLAPLPISELILNRTGIDDAGLATLSGPFGPRGLSLQDTKATPGGIAAFGLAHPGVLQSGGLLDDD